MNRKPSNNVNPVIFLVKYLFVFQLELLALKLNFGVLTKGVFLPAKPSNTATALCSESPMEKLKNKGKCPKKYLQPLDLFSNFEREATAYKALIETKLKRNKEAYKNK